MLARLSVALLAVLLPAIKAQPSEAFSKSLFPACCSAVDVSPATIDEWIDCDIACPESHCPLSTFAEHCCWYFQADALWLARTSGRSRPLIVASDSGASLLATSDLNLSFQPGPRLLLGHRSSLNRCWELSYFGLFEWREAGRVQDPNNLDINGSLMGLAQDYSGADWMVLDYSARLHNIEANIVDEHGAWSVLGGLRYLHLQEKSVLTASDSDSGVSDYTTWAQSDLIGPQLGLRSGWRGGWVSWQLTLKAGLYGAVLHQQQRMLDSDRSFLLREGSAAKFLPAFVGDLNWESSLPLSDTWSLRGGYFAMYAAGVALSTDQLDFENLSASGQRVSGGDLFLHGVSLGLEASW